MTGMVGVISDYSARFSWFTQCLADLQKPVDTKIEWRMGANRGAMRNALVQACLDQGRPWLFFVDDDQAFHTTTLNRLLALEQPVVSALILQRAAPFLPTAYAERDEDGNYLTLDLKSVGHNNLVQVAATGTGGLLVRAEIFQELGPPWFVYSEDFGEDMYFANRLAEAGIPMLLDTGCRMGHLAPAGIFPFWGPAGWQAEFKYSDGTTIPLALEHKEKSS